MKETFCDLFKDDDDQQILFTIKPEEYEQRIDLRSKRIFTIDSNETRVRDDAIHIETIDEDTIEIGFHVADCSELLEIPKERIHELFETHCNQLKDILLKKRVQKQCNYIDKYSRLSLSLDAGKERRAISLIIHYGKEFNQKETPKVIKSIIKVHCNLDQFQCDSLLNNQPIGNSNHWRSYGIKHQYGIMNETTTLSQIRTDLFELHRFVESIVHFEQKEIIPSDYIVKYIGIFLGDLVGEILFDKYKEFALVFDNGQKMFTSFRSPLRKFIDVCVIKQLSSLIYNHSIDEMIENFFGFTKNEFEEIVSIAKDCFKND